ncbi:hypothetical protein GWI33_020646 [Rhynchophorus ferrugineus]|uniref:RNA helicase n=1 Tax=Rhynchophorus ferrugineus TaxID=354439 RepID=A0A834HVZ3_RHYFE|nr:hypothetical protein GWI33_020646 [Rhynchophorus ferrugineus]
MSDHVQLAHSLENTPRTKDVVLDENISFQSLFLPENILKGLSDAGFQKPSPIQKKALPMGRCGFDLIVQSKSGTGKTLVFSIIALETIKLNKKEPQVLILSPTREIAVQIQDVIKTLGKYFEELQVVSFIGGLSIELDKVNCKSCHVAVGTPGRIKHLIQNGYLCTTSIKLFIVDEADKLIEDSFQNDVNEIYNSLPDRKQIIMSSATYSDELKEFLKNYMLSPTCASIESDNPLLLGLKHFVRIVIANPCIVPQIIRKNAEILRVLSTIPFKQCIVFSNYQSRAETLSNFLNRNGWKSIYISSSQRQDDRLNSLNSLKDFKCRIMVSTDLSSRGIDSANIDLIINYDIPVDAPTYLHRMGRAGRYGSSGICINLALLGKELDILQNILGIIGGPNLSIPVLNDELTIENSSHESLTSIVPVDVKDFTEKCKTAVIKMKKKLTKLKKTLKPKSSDHEQNCEEAVLSKLSTVDAGDILQQLASGTLDLTTCNSTESANQELKHITDEENETKLTQEEVTSSDNLDSELKKKDDQSESSESGVDNAEISKDNIDTISILQQLANQTFEGFSDNIKEEKKRKRSVSFGVPQNEPNQQELFYRNKALFGVTKSICNAETDNNDTEYLAQYLSVLKAKENEEYHQVFDVDRKQETLDLENIFLTAYKSQTISSSVAWQELIPADEKWKLDKTITKLEEGDNEYCAEDDYEEDYDFEMEKDIEVHIGQNVIQNKEDQDDYSFMKWIPVEPAMKNIPENVPSSVSNINNQKLEPYSSSGENLGRQRGSLHYHEQYNHYYQQASDNLWQNGLQFDNVNSFDDWFYYSWENQMTSIRNFIQQKIYLEELNSLDSRHRRNPNV